MTPLESRKQLLLAESDLNRAEMAADIVAMRSGAHALAERAKTFSSIASSAVILLSALTACKGEKTVAPGAKTPWWRTMLKGAGVISSLWLAFRPQAPGRDED